MSAGQWIKSWWRRGLAAIGLCEFVNTRTHWAAR
ncbi:hypothetical protein EV384_3954 [Micromonospora kangleipakensis]|uniref:Uncharacterized protein n=1 Tax=Micromonospora kangleipakensis TaxID=1077942 RepID=A0A4Q8BDZ0_9ACTN|nr:hypothetical protein EV384_3954 [Micromonospora kangleipakensis]